MLAMSKIKKSAPGPKGIPHWVWKENANILAPVITASWSLSWKKHTRPSAWKQANINLLPTCKVHTPLEYQDFRGINVTPIIARCVERIACRTFSKSMIEAILSSQFGLMHYASCNITAWKLSTIQKLTLLDYMQWIFLRHLTMLDTFFKVRNLRLLILIHLNLNRINW